VPVLRLRQAFWLLADISKKATPEPSFWLIYYKGYGF
jgi:hypothetical protein